MPLSGYVGEQVYSGYFREYLALLQFMAEINVGNETVYGMGKYEVENGIINSKTI
jgi:CRISPR/Cas system endoribonuclease Cas6 (RAMP superfamily)